VQKEEANKMNKLKIILFLTLLIYINKSFSQIECTYEIAEDVYVIDGTNELYQPGDVICLKPGNKEYLLIKDVHGTANNYITIINKSGRIIIDTDNYYGVKISNCSFLKLSGNGNGDGSYGVYVKRVGQGTGLAVGDLSTDIEIENLEISNIPIAGVYAKTDPTCNDLSSTRDKFTMYNFSFHDCYVHDVADEGLYIGSSKYTGQELQECDTTVLPHVLIGTRIFNNIIENTGWDGIQVSSAENDCEIYGNKIKNDSYEMVESQMSGIIIGSGSRCKVYNNVISNGHGDGIDIFGLGSLYIFNNLIVNAGDNYHPDIPTDFKHGIYLGNVVTEPNEPNYIYNNTIINPKSFGITYANNQEQGNIINNIIVEPGYTDAGENAFINITNNSSADIKNNYTTMDIYSVKFVSVSTNNYDLQASSPAVDKGFNMSNQGLTFDINNRERPFHQHYDIGAYECQDPHISIKENENPKISIYPNPANNHLTVTLLNNTELKYLQVISLTGEILINKSISDKRNKITLNTSTLKEGYYILAIKPDNSNTLTTPLIIVRYGQ
jgi:hypothetical protein